MSQVPDDDLVEIDIDPNFDFTDLSKRVTKPVVNTQIEGGSTSGKAPNVGANIDFEGGGTPSSSKCGGCNALDIGCEIGKLSCEFTSSSFSNLLSNRLVWVVVAIVVILVLVAVIKK